MSKNGLPILAELERLRRMLTKDYILLARIGDWWEAFGEDAVAASPLLGATLTARADVPMCGVPHHALDTALAKLVRAGRSVALVGLDGECRRVITRIVTPGVPREVA